MKSGSPIERIAVIGLGAMGTPIASRLLQAGYRVSGYDPVKKRMMDLGAAGLVETSSARAAVAGAQLVILSLRTWQVVREVVEGAEGILEALDRGAIIADTSTVPPARSREMAELAAGRGVEWLDVPISGAANQARAGDMVFMFGGKRSVFEAVAPVFSRIGKKSVYVGRNGDAAMLKLVVNLTLFLNQAAAVEGLSLGLKAGLDPAVMLDVMISGAAGSDLLEQRGKDMVDGRFDPKGPVWLAVKDLGLALESAEELGVALPMAGLYRQVLLAAHNTGWDEQDATVTMRLYEGRAK